MSAADPASPAHDRDRSRSPRAVLDSSGAAAASAPLGVSDLSGGAAVAPPPRAVSDSSGAAGASAPPAVSDLSGAAAASSPQGVSDSSGAAAAAPPPRQTVFQFTAAELDAMEQQDRDSDAWEQVLRVVSSYRAAGSPCLHARPYLFQAYLILEAWHQSGIAK